MTIKRNRLIFGLFVSITLLSACNLPRATPVTSIEPGAIYTQAALTVQAQYTQGAVNTPILPPTQTPQPAPPTATAFTPPPSPTTMPPTPAPPTTTPLPPTATPVPIPCDRASFVQDVTFPDNTEVAAGTTFVKTWRLRNNGSCTWTSGYSIIFYSGDAMGGPASAQLTSGTVAPGATVDVSVTLRAPDTPGTYRGDWKLRNAAGATFGIGEYADKSFWVQIKVVSPQTPTPTRTPTPVANVTFDFVARGPDAQWRNGSGPIPWGDPPDDSAGVAVDLPNVKLDDGKTYNKALATYPQRITDGIIVGAYPLYTVQSGDHFRTIIGLRDNCGVGRVRYQLKYSEGSGEVLLGEWLETCDDKVTSIDLDLSSLNGKTVQFILIVMTDGPSDDDISLWIYPRIER